MRAKVFCGMVGVSFLAASVIQGLALSGVNFGDIPIQKDWIGGLLPAGFAIAATLLLKTALSEPAKTNSIQ